LQKENSELREEIAKIVNKKTHANKADKHEETRAHNGDDEYPNSKESENDALS